MTSEIVGIENVYSLWMHSWSKTKHLLAGRHYWVNMSKLRLKQSQEYWGVLSMDLLNQDLPLGERTCNYVEKLHAADAAIGKSNMSSPNGSWITYLTKKHSMTAATVARLAPPSCDRQNCGPVFGYIDGDPCNQTCILQHFLRSTRSFSWNFKRLQNVSFFRFFNLLRLFLWKLNENADFLNVAIL